MMTYGGGGRRYTVGASVRVGDLWGWEEEVHSRCVS